MPDEIDVGKLLNDDQQMIDRFRDNDLEQIKLKQRKQSSENDETDLMMGSFVGDSKKLIPHLYDQEVATERF